MLYSEQFPVSFEGGIHNGTISGLKHFWDHGLKLNGMVPNYDNANSLMSQHRDPNSLVEMTVEHPDPQTARDIAYIAKHTILNGRDFWPGRVLPLERFNQGANYLRNHHGDPQEGPMQIQAATKEAFGVPPDWFTTALETAGVIAVAPGAAAAAALAPAINLWNTYRAQYGENPSALQTYIQMLKSAWQSKSPNAPAPSYEDMAAQLRGVTNKAAASAVVSGDMSTLSKWVVVSVGELQQPGGVGATQDYNPVVDGPNPDGPNFADNAGNSPEQEVALQTWVNVAVDLLNRGTSPEEIIAKLAHDGCPNPEEVLQRAQQQPEHSPITDDIGQDPFDAPAPPDPTMNGQMESTSQQPPVVTSKRIRIAGTTMTGTELDRWENVWGEGTVKIALDGGGTLEVAPEAVESLSEGTYKHPVTEIQSFIDSLPEVKPTRPHINARLENLELVRRAVRANISKVGFSDQVKLQEIDSDAAAETEVLKEILSNHAETFDIAYAKAARRFKFNAFDVAQAEVTAYLGNAREAGAIWASENFDGPVEDDDSFKSAAAHYASRIGLNGPEFQQFLAGADEHRHVRTEEFTATEPETTENEGPAEALFIN